MLLVATCTKKTEGGEGGRKTKKMKKMKRKKKELHRHLPDCAGGLGKSSACQKRKYQGRNNEFAAAVAGFLCRRPAVIRGPRQTNKQAKQTKKREGGRGGLHRPKTPANGARGSRAKNNKTKNQPVKTSCERWRKERKESNRRGRIEFDSFRLFCAAVVVVVVSYGGYKCQTDESSTMCWSWTAGGEKKKKNTQKRDTERPADNKHTDEYIFHIYIYCTQSYTVIPRRRRSVTCGPPVGLHGVRLQWKVWHSRREGKHKQKKPRQVFQ